MKQYLIEPSEFNTFPYRQDYNVLEVKPNGDKIVVARHLTGSDAGKCVKRLMEEN